MAKAVIVGIALLGAEVSADPLRSVFRMRIPEPTSLNFQVPEEETYNGNTTFADMQPANVEHLFYPYGMVNKASGRRITRDPPWAVTENPQAKVFRSHFVTSKLEAYFAQKAPGLEVSYREVFNALERRFCVPYVVGGLIRDILWRQEGLDTDIGFTCPLLEIKQICDDNNWPVFIKPKSHYMRIGTPGVSDPIEGKVVEDSLYAPNAILEYAVNTLAYDAGINSVIIDRSGFGVDDDRTKTIRVPGDRSEWDDWVKGESGTTKIFRYWKLRAAPKSFTGEPKTQEFIVSTLKSRMEAESTTKETQAVGKHQLKHFLEGMEKTKALEKLGHIRDAMIEDLGKEWYDANIRPLEPTFPKGSGELLV